MSQDNALLEETLAATRRGREVIMASVAVALTGALFLMQALQFYAFYRMYWSYRMAPHVLLVVGVALLAIGSRLYSQRVWAAIAAAALSGVAALLMGAWYVVMVVLGPMRVNPLTALLPFAAAAAALLAGLAIAPCKRTEAALRRAAAAGLDLD